MPEEPLPDLCKNNGAIFAGAGELVIRRKRRGFLRRGARRVGTGSKVRAIADA